MVFFFCILIYLLLSVCVSPLGVTVMLLSRVALDVLFALLKLALLKNKKFKKKKLVKKT